MSEVWKEITGFNGMYEVSNQGRVRSWMPSKNRHTPYNYNKSDNPKILSPSKNLQGYYGVTLFENRNRKRKTVHRLVAETFIPNPESKPQINHKDGDKTNNHADNLGWVTCSENHKHAFKIGLKNHKGENSNYVKLTRKDVLDIRNANRLGCFTHKELGEAYGVKRSTIGSIINRRTWKHI